MRVVFSTPDGAELMAGPPAGLTLKRDADAPADSLELFFAFDFPAELAPCTARLEYSGEAVFDGIVDEQTVALKRGRNRRSFRCAAGRPCCSTMKPSRERSACPRCG